MEPQVLVDRNAKPVILIGKGRKKYYVIAARDSDIAFVRLDTLDGLRPELYQGKPYPVRKCASFWLNRDFRPVTKRAKPLLRELVARKRDEP